MNIKAQLSHLTKGSLSITDYFMKAKKMSNSLVVARCPLSDDDLIMYVLNGFDKSFDPVIIHVQSRLGFIDYNKVMSLMLTQESKMEQRITSMRIEANLAQSRPNQKKFNNQRGRGMSNGYNTAGRGFVDGGNQSFGRNFAGN